MVWLKKIRSQIALLPELIGGRRFFFEGAPGNFRNEEGIVPLVYRFGHLLLKDECLCADLLRLEALLLRESLVLGDVLLLQHRAIVFLRDQVLELLL